MKTVIEALDAMLALYAAPGAGSLEDILYQVIGDPEEEGISEAEWRRRCALVSGVSDTCGVDLAAFGDLARHPGAVAAVLHAGRHGLL